jgi:hypothetical protein
MLNLQLSECVSQLLDSFIRRLTCWLTLRDMCQFSCLFLKLLEKTVPLSLDVFQLLDEELGSTSLFSIS